jgi:hypothetical protein
MNVSDFVPQFAETFRSTTVEPPTRRGWGVNEARPLCRFCDNVIQYRDAAANTRLRDPDNCTFVHAHCVSSYLADHGRTMAILADRKVWPLRWLYIPSDNTVTAIGNFPDICVCFTATVAGLSPDMGWQYWRAVVVASHADSIIHMPLTGGFHVSNHGMDGMSLAAHSQIWTATALRAWWPIVERNLRAVSPTVSTRRLRKVTLRK